MLQTEDIPDLSQRITPEWLAGFFDGEGSIITQVSYDTYFTAGFTLTQKDPGILTLIALKYGGSPDSIKPVKSSNGICHRWRCRGNTALPFLKSILPHVVVKYRQVALAVELLELLSLTGDHRRKWGRFHGKSVNDLADSDLDRRMHLANEIQKYNQEGNESGDALRTLNKKLGELGYKQ